MKQHIAMITLGALLLSGCGLFYKGPDEETVIRIARAQQIANAPSPAHEKAARDAQYSWGGRCEADENNENLYSCTVNTTVTLNEITADQQLVMQVKRAANGGWDAVK